MKIEESVEELINKFLFFTEDSDLDDRYNKAKQYAIICVDEIINALYEYDDRTEDYLKKDFNLYFHSCELQNMDGDFRYWDKFKKILNETNI